MAARLRLLIAAAGLSGCVPTQSALAPAGQSAAEIATLTSVMVIGGTAIALLTFGLAALAILMPPDRRRWMTGRPFLAGFGIAFPLVILTGLLGYGLFLTGATGRLAGNDPLTVAVTGEQFWWRVTYPATGEMPGFETANEIRIPTGRSVVLELRSADVIHSFWVPSLAGKLDMIPGQVNRLVISAERAGVYRGQCTEFCGAQHARMAFYVVAEDPPAFERWATAQSRPAAEPKIAMLQRGKDLFNVAGCGSCHTVRGTAAGGRLGPDLTKVGSRRSIAAGTLPNNVGTLAGWVASAQHLKPGNKMPSFDVLTGEELRAIAHYLESLQ